jgi:S1-C subfamily serine protease
VKVFQAQIPLNSGNSGGGLYTAAGELIGINSWTLPKGMVEGMGFSISIENLLDAGQKLPAEIADAIRGGPVAPVREPGPAGPEGSR